MNTAVTLFVNIKLTPKLYRHIKHHYRNYARRLLPFLQKLSRKEIRGMSYKELRLIYLYN